MFLLIYIAWLIAAIVLVIMIYHLVRGLTLVRKSKLSGNSVTIKAGKTNLIIAGAFAIFFVLMVWLSLYILWA